MKIRVVGMECVSKMAHVCVIQCTPAPAAMVAINSFTKMETALAPVCIIKKEGRGGAQRKT